MCFLVMRVLGWYRLARLVRAMVFHCTSYTRAKPGMVRNEVRASPGGDMSLRGGVTCTRADPIAEWILLVQLLLRVRTADKI